MKVLVTGAHGFLGSHITKAFLQSGDSVRALVTPWGETHNLRQLQDDPGLELVRADLTVIRMADRCRVIDGADVGWSHGC